MYSSSDKYKILKSIHIPAADISVLENNIVHVHAYARGEMPIQDVENIFYYVRELTEDKPSYRIVTAEDKFLIPSYESRMFLISEERVAFVLGEVYIIQNFIPKMMLELYIHTKNIPFPIRQFTSFDKGYEWLVSLQRDK